MNVEKLMVYEEWEFNNLFFEKLEYLLDEVIKYFKENKKVKVIVVRLIKTKKLELPNGQILKSDIESRNVCIKRNGEIIYL